jgi:hypothetical protein
MAQSHGLLDQVDSLIEHAKQAPISLPNGDGDFIQSQLVRYGCLLTCAAIEQAIVDSATSYARRVGDERLGGFISEMLRTGRNPWPSYIRAVFGKFDSTWGAHIGEYIADNVGDHNVNSIVSNRNRIAHGESVSLGVASLIQWAPAARKLCLEIARLTATVRPERRARPRRRRAS